MALMNNSKVVILKLTNSTRTRGKKSQHVHHQQYDPSHLTHRLMPINCNIFQPYIYTFYMPLSKGRVSKKKPQTCPRRRYTYQGKIKSCVMCSPMARERPRSTPAPSRTGWLCRHSALCSRPVCDLRTRSSVRG